ncbi:MAG: hypothetical protein A2Y94_06270 [Caldithrix sp. RBG_13_44_9]|nr:MAG: hypothetical protein A2Y94_06270 [Caldithrix sp. RBG_13_44_9]
MGSIKSRIARSLVSWRIKKNYRQLAKSEVHFPVTAAEVKNVLILLPLNGLYLDSAMTLVRHLRQHFQKWHFMILDLGKIPADKLDRFQLPTPDFVAELDKNDFQLVLDLNFEHDLRIHYLIGSMKIPYRLHLQFSDSAVYNMFAQIKPDNFKSFHHVFDYLQSSFIV